VLDEVGEILISYLEVLKDFLGLPIEIERFIAYFNSL
jgi:hypothetical protein